MLVFQQIARAFVFVAEISIKVRDAVPIENSKTFRISISNVDQIIYSPKYKIEIHKLILSEIRF